MGWLLDKLSAKPVPAPTPEGVIDLTNPAGLVVGWNKLAEEARRLDELLNVQWTVANHKAYSDITRQLAEIELGCVIAVVSRKVPSNFAQQSVEKFRGRDLRDSLGTFDHEAITALQARIVTGLKADLDFIRTGFADKHREELSSQPASTVSYIEAQVNHLAWCAISNFYRIAVMNHLGSPNNIYVVANVSDLFVGLLYSEKQKQGWLGERDAVKAEIASTARDLIRFTQAHFGGDEDTGLTKLLAVITMPAGMTEQMAETLANLFRSFVNWRKPAIGHLIAYG